MSVKYKVTLLLCLCAGVWVCGSVYSTLASVSITGHLVQALSGDMVVLIDPFSVALEVDLGGRRRPAPHLHRPVLHDERVLRFQQEFREGFRRRRWEGVRENLGLAVVAAICKHRAQTLLGKCRCSGNT